MPHYRFYNNVNTLCITVPELVECGVSEMYIWKKTKEHRKGLINTWPHHKEGREVFIHYHGIADKYRLLIDNKICQGVSADRHTASGDFIDNLITLDKDRTFINEFRFADNSPIEPAKLPEMYKKCAILNLVNVANLATASQYGFKNMPSFWSFILEQIRNTGLKMPNQSYFSLKRKAIEYREKGPIVVIDGRTGNNNTQKVSEQVEQILLNLFARDNKPYFVKVWNQYDAFITGKQPMVCMKTGEIIKPEDICDKSGNRIIISKSTVYNWITKPYNQAAVDKVRTSGLEYTSKHRPHVMRHAPVYAFSKISMDDIDVPFKMHDGTRVKAYQIFDVTSGAVVGSAFSRDKNRDLFVDALRNMFTTILINGWKMPAEIEIEQHIANTFKDDLLRAGELFPFVRFCRGANPQEKRAEGKIKRKKYSVQSEREGFQYRPFARLESNRMNEDKNKKRYTYQEIVDNEWKDIATYNDQVPTQKDVAKNYPGMTRKQIIEQCQHPNLTTPDMHVLAWYVGNKKETSIRRGMYVTVCDEKYMLPDPEVLTKLNNYGVIASYIQTGKTIDKVYLYQDGHYICECKLAKDFNESQFERTDDDLHIMHQQQAYIAKHDKMIKERRDWAQELKYELMIEDTETPITKETETIKEPVFSDASEEERLLIEKFGRGNARNNYK